MNAKKFNLWPQGRCVYCACIARGSCCKIPSILWIPSCLYLKEWCVCTLLRSTRIWMDLSPEPWTIYYGLPPAELSSTKPCRLHAAAILYDIIRYVLILIPTDYLLMGKCIVGVKQKTDWPLAPVEVQYSLYSESSASGQQGKNRCATTTITHLTSPCNVRLHILLTSYPSCLCCVRWMG